MATTISHQSDETKKSRPGKIRTRIRIVSVATILLVAGITFFYAITLPWLLHLLFYYETPLEPADVVLLGGTGGALDTAVEYYRNGYAKAILITQAVPESYKHIDKPIFPYHFIREDLRKAGIPDADVFHLEREGKTMLETRQILRDWMYAHHIRSYLCFPGAQTSRITKILHDHTFPNGDVKAIIRPYQGRHILRKQLLGLHNTMVRMAYWYCFYRPLLRAESSLSSVPSL
ncbi:MAG: hypothetical protein C4527_27765 [Candidatus Omnitrophota bacterium]|jgi:hypothetical protein|nr:MAG: hypothetical protein C4527_27765 [Candidatus Omnitrophota bacterium]